MWLKAFLILRHILWLPLPSWPKIYGHMKMGINFKTGNTATLVACGWAGAVFAVDRAFGQE